MPKGVYTHGKLSEITKAKIGVAQKGKLHWNWQGGKTQESMSIRNSVEYKKWRISIFERDGYRCQKCGKDKCYLQAHHIIHFADDREKIFDITNGITLCRECHCRLPGHRRLLTAIEKEKISKKLLGRKFSEKTRKKMSESKKGCIPWNKGNIKNRPVLECFCGQKFIQKRVAQTYCSQNCARRKNGSKRKYLIESNIIDVKSL